MRTMISLATAAALATLAGCAIIVVPDGADGDVHFATAFGDSATVQGNGQVTTERREAGAATGLDINGPIQMDVQVGAAPSLQVEGDSNLLSMLRTDASGGTLRVWVEGRPHPSKPLHVIYTTAQLDRVASNGSGRLSVAGLNGGALTLTQNGSRAVQLAGSVGRLEVRLNGSGSVNATGLESGATVVSLNGSGRLDMGRMRGDSLSVDLHGSGGINASGAVRSMSVRTYGSGSAELAGLSSETAELSSYGSGSISAAVSRSLVADSNGSGRVTVYGNPSQRSVSGKHVTVIQ